MKYVIDFNELRSGKSGASVYFRNHIIRDWVPVINRGTEPQAEQRALLASLSERWNLLTELQRDGWRSLFLNRVDELGVPYQVTGKALFVSCNQNLVNSGNASITIAPALALLPAAPTSLILSSTAGADHFSLAFTPTPVAAGHTMLVYATPQLSAGTYNPSPSKYRLIDLVAAGGASPQSSAAEWDAEFGTPIAGNSVFGKVIIVENATGFASAPVISRAIIA